MWHCAACRSEHVNALNTMRHLEYRETAQCVNTYCFLEKVFPQRAYTSQCALVEPMSVGFHAISRAEVRILDTVMVLGAV